MNASPASFDRPSYSSSRRSNSASSLRSSSRNAAAAGGPRRGADANGAIRASGGGWWTRGCAEVELAALLEQRGGLLVLLARAEVEAEHAAVREQQLEPLRVRPRKGRILGVVLSAQGGLPGSLRGGLLVSLRVGDGLRRGGTWSVGMSFSAAFPGALKEAAEREPLLEHFDGKLRRPRCAATASSRVGRRRVVLRRHHEAVGLGRDAVAVGLVDLRHREQRARPPTPRPTRTPPMGAPRRRVRSSAAPSEQRHELGGQRRLARRRRRGGRRRARASATPGTLSMRTTRSRGCFFAAPSPTSGAAPGPRKAPSSTAV